MSHNESEQSILHRMITTSQELEVRSMANLPDDEQEVPGIAGNIREQTILRIEGKKVPGVTYGYDSLQNYYRARFPAYIKGKHLYNWSGNPGSGKTTNAELGLEFQDLWIRRTTGEHHRGIVNVYWEDDGEVPAARERGMTNILRPWQTNDLLLADDYWGMRVALGLSLGDVVNAEGPVFSGYTTQNGSLRGRPLGIETALEVAHRTGRFSGLDYATSWCVSVASPIQELTAMHRRDDQHLLIVDSQHRQNVKQTNSLAISPDIFSALYRKGKEIDEKEARRLKSHGASPEQMQYINSVKRQEINRLEAEELIKPVSATLADDTYEQFVKEPAKRLGLDERIMRTLTAISLAEGRMDEYIARNVLHIPQEEIVFVYTNPNFGDLVSNAEYLKYRLLQKESLGLPIYPVSLT